MKRVRVAKSIGFLESISIALSLVIGSSIFVFPLITAREAGPLSIISWVIGAIYAFVVGLLISELAIKYTKEGGPYLYLYKAFGKRIGFISGWIFWLSYILSFSVEIMILKLLLDFLFPSYSIIISIFVAVALSVLNIFGMKISGLIEDILTILKVLAIIIIIFFSFQNFSVSNIQNLPKGNYLNLILYSTLVSMYAYTGFEIVTVPEEEIKSARKIIRRSIMISITLSSLFFILCVIAIVGLKDWHSFTNYETIFDLYYEINPIIGAVVLIGGIISIFTSINALIVGSSRISFSMSKDNMLPNAFSHLNSAKVPDYSILFQLLTAILLLLAIDDIEFLAVYSVSLIIFIYFACTIASLILIKHNIIENRILAFLSFLLTTLMFLSIGEQAMIFLLFSIISGVLFYFLENFRFSSKR